MLGLWLTGVMVHAGAIAPCPGVRMYRQSRPMLIDDFQRTDLVSRLGTCGRSVSDQVMGGTSTTSLAYETTEGRACLRLRGEVRLEDNHGFVQMALDLAADGRTIDATDFDGVGLAIRGNHQRYSVHLRTADNDRPWQSYRASFVAQAHWRKVRLPFHSFQAHRLDTPLDTQRLRRFGLVAIGRAFTADLAVAEVMLYSNV